jgi:hypothetical protein
VASQGDKLESPFVGLVPFAEDEKDYFFGRASETRLIVANLFASRFTLLYGSSGVGKSSVLRAGVMRAFEEKQRNREPSDQAGVELVAIYFSEWQQKDALPRLCNAVAVRLGVEGTHHSVVSMLEHVTRERPVDVMLVLDQFEDYFLYSGTRGAPDFERELAELANCESLPVRILVSVRDDAVSQLDRFKESIPELFANYLRLRPLTAAAAEDAIREPVRVWNERHGTDIRVEDAVIEEVIGSLRAGRPILAEGGAPDTASQAGIEAPYLQLVLSKLWATERDNKSSVLTQRTLSALGGAATIVKQHVDNVVNKFSFEDREICASIFKFLVTPAGGKIAQSLDGLAELADLPQDPIYRVVQSLVAGGARILAPVPAPLNQPKRSYYEVFHDSLAPAILDWRRRFELARVEETAAAERQRADREVRRRQRDGALFIGLTVILLGMLAITWEMRRQAKAASESMEELRRKTGAQRNEAQSEKDQAMSHAAMMLARQRAEHAALQEKWKKQEQEQEVRRRNLLAENARLEHEGQAKRREIDDVRKETKAQLAEGLPGHFTMQCEGLLRREKIRTENLLRELNACKTAGAGEGQEAPARDSQ